MKLIFTTVIFFHFTMLIAQPNWDWAVQQRTDFYDYMTDVDHDAYGNLYMCGDFEDSISIGDTVLYGNSFNNIFLAKYDPYGNLVWARTATSTDAAYVRDVCVAPDGSIYITGNYMDDPIMFWPVILSGVRDIFLVKYDPYGGVVWAKTAGGANNDNGYSVTTDYAGNVIITGMFESTVCSFDSHIINPINTATPDGYIAKYDSNGNALWARSCGGGSWDNAVDAECDGLGNVYVTGTFHGYMMSAGAISLTGSGNYDIFIVKYSASGSEIWGRSFGGIGLDQGTCVKVNSLGNVIMNGVMGTDTVVFDTYILLPAQGGIFLASLDSAGNVIWALNEGSPGYYVSYVFREGIGVDGSDNIYLAGHYTTPFTDVSGTTLYNVDPSGNTADFFIARYDANGNNTWIYENGSALNDAIYGITVKDIDNYAIVGGFVGGSILFPPDTLVNTGIASYFLAQAGSGLTNDAGFNTAPQSIFMYPNPTNDILNITLNHGYVLQELYVQIADNSGKVIFMKSLNDYNVSIDCGWMSPGVYVLSVVSADGSRNSRKFIVK